MCSSEYHQQLSPETFELDLVEEEKLHQIAVSSNNNNSILIRGAMTISPFLPPFRSVAVVPLSLAVVTSTRGLSLRMAASPSQ